MKVIAIIGNRPQFIKAAVVQGAWRESGFSDIDMRLVHTGQHYDKNLSDIFFDELNIGEPHHNLGVQAGDATGQIALMLQRLRPVFEEEVPDAVLVYGDTNSTLAGALTAAHMNIPVIHVEAGERLYIRKNQPEELNRLVADCLSTLCLTASKKAANQLRAEGMSDSRINFVGDTMYDLFLKMQASLDEGFISQVLRRSGVGQGDYVLATIHRAENTDDPERLSCILDNLDRMKHPVVLPLHPRTEKCVRAMEWRPKGGLIFIDPCGYKEIMALLLRAKFTVTDSGGLSRESFWARKPSIVPMSAPPWPEIVDAGWMNMVVPLGDSILECAKNINFPDTWPDDLFGDGRASERIIAVIRDFFSNGTAVDWKSAHFQRL